MSAIAGGGNMKNKKIVHGFFFTVVTVVMMSIFGFSRADSLTTIVPVSFSPFNTPQALGAPLNSGEIENSPFLAPKEEKGGLS
jgi:hypothetical protein